MVIESYISNIELLESYANEHHLTGNERIKRLLLKKWKPILDHEKQNQNKRQSLKNKILVFS